jgi:hypothetical protein
VWQQHGSCQARNEMNEKTTGITVIKLILKEQELVLAASSNHRKLKTYLINQSDSVG